MKTIISVLGGCILLLFLALGNVKAADRSFFHGVNLAGAEFAPHVIPGKDGTNYLWPTSGDIAKFVDIGANIIRVPFLWERMQPVLNKPLNAEELARLDAVIAAASATHTTILLDVHNYGTYNNEPIGSRTVPITAFSDLWMRLAQHYRKNPQVAFGLMNEPHLQQADLWNIIAQSAVYAIRAVGARQLILVPGTRYTGAHSWLSSAGGISNALALRSIQDPANHFVFEVHQYFDSDSSGTHSNCVSADIGVKRLTDITSWLRRNGYRGFLGEFGASKDPVCLDALKQTLEYMSDNHDVWYGWTYWAGSQWLGDYMFNIYPPDDTQRFPQVDILKRAMNGF